MAAGAGAGVLQGLGPVPHQAPAPAEPPHHEAAAVPPAPETPHPASPPVPDRFLVAAPDPALLERSPTYPPAQLPRVAADGRAARTAYAAPAVPVPPNAAPIALLVSGVGLSERDTAAAIDTLPGPVSLAVSAYATMPPATLAAARAAGHELFVSIPMEPQGYPLNDEGPHSLLSGADPIVNRANLEWALSRLDGAVGATGASDGMRGERFADLSSGLDVVLREVGRRGLLYIDPRPDLAAQTGPYTRDVDAVVDDPPARAEMEAKLATLERTAREKGAALGLAVRIQPMTLQRLAEWTRTLPGRGFVLVPVSQLVRTLPHAATATR